MTHGYVSTALPAGNIKIGYLHLETDDEYRERVFTELGENAKYWRYDLGLAKGLYLDTMTWDLFMKQRRIVEVLP